MSIFRPKNEVEMWGKEKKSHIIIKLPRMKCSIHTNLNLMCYNKFIICFRSCFPMTDGILTTELAAHLLMFNLKML